ncbi:hypothetical protein CNT_KDOLBLKC_03887 [Bacillus subtilis]|uniref:C39 family peptidase n=1 Tax=Bacillus subtilis TaxID=1423 RepID=UPI001C230FF7|nr:C39 family peptidase [Bacillus subtilis]MBU8678749.1 C39 family peptidase [Bacillus subtilis]
METEPIMLNIKRIKQEDPRKYCAPACIQMILHSYGINQTQNEIWNASRPLLAPQSQGVWYTDPEAVGSYLNSVDAVSSKIKVNDLSREDITFTISKIARNIIYYRHAPAILVWGGAHWVTVAGIQGSFSGNSFEKGEISGLWIADPGRGQADIEFMPINEWFLQKYLTPCKVSNDKIWKDKFVVVGEASDDIIDDLAIIQRPSGGGGIINEEKMTDVILEDIKFFGLGTGSRLLGGGAVDLSPKKVRILDTDAHYFLTPVDINDRLAWTAFVSQESGTIFNSLTGVIFTNELELPPTGNELKELLLSKFSLTRITFEEKEGLFWRVCRELPSMFDVVRIIEYDGKEFFITSRKEVLDQLHFKPNSEYLAG